MGDERLQRGRKTTLRADVRLALGFASIVIVGCAPPVEGHAEHSPMGRTIQRIVNGSASGADQDAVVALARFENGARVGLCTATLVAPNLALTARHCVSATDPSAACGSDGAPVVGAMLHGDRAAGALAVFTSTSGGLPDTTNQANASAHGKTLVVDDATTICNHDLAFVILDASLSSPIAPVRLGTTSATDLLTAVGFGITELGALPALRMQRSGLALVGLGPMQFPDDARYGAGDAELVIGESACAGDSGSPALAASGAVVGVASRAGNGQARDPNNAASTCLGANAHAVYAELGRSQALVLRAFSEAGAAPWLEGQPDPRAKPATAAPGKSASAASPPPSENAADDDDHVDTAPPMPPTGEREPSSAGGCSASGEPTHGAVEDALGIVFLLLLVLRFRSAGRERERLSVPADAKGRIPYVDLGMRESLASFSDER